MALAERGDVRGHTSPDRAELSGSEPDISTSNRAAR
jgi:hypothetical protein